MQGLTQLGEHMRNLNASFRRIFGERTDVESRSAALVAQRTWLREAYERQQRQSTLENCQALARDLRGEYDAVGNPHSHYARNLRRAAGFTLIELLVSVAIVGILAAGAVYAYSGYSTNAQVSEGVRIADGIMESAVASFQSNGVIPATNAEAGVAQTIAKYVQSTGVNNGSVDIVFGKAASSTITGLVLEYTPYLTSDGQTIAWSCGYATPQTGWTAMVSDATGTAPLGTTVPSEFLPRSCRAGG